MFNLTAAGNITADATSQEVSTANGTIHAIRFTIAMNEKYGESEKSCFLPCTYWVKSDKIVPHLTKGKAVIAQIDWYSNTEHEGRYYQDFRVRKLDFQRGERQSQQPPLNPAPGVEAEKTNVFAQKNAENTANQTAKTPEPFNPFADEEEDDLPF